MRAGYPGATRLRATLRPPDIEHERRRTNDERACRRFPVRRKRNERADARARLGGDPLGPPDGWPQSLQTVVRILLTSRYAMWMGWGPELTFLYNAAYAEMTLGAKHPWALGKPASMVWREIWKDVGPRIRTVLETGTATWDEALLLFLERSGCTEEIYHTFSYSPLADDDGTIAGLFCVVTEETERVIGERRLRVLRDVATRMGNSRTTSEVFDGVLAELGAHGQDGRDGGGS